MKKEKEPGYPLNKFITELGNAKQYSFALMPNTIKGYLRVLSGFLEPGHQHLSQIE